MSGVILALSLAARAATIDVTLAVPAEPPGPPTPRVQTRMFGGGARIEAPDGDYLASEPGFACVVGDGRVFARFVGDTGAWPSPRPETVRCAIGADEVIIHVVEPDHAVMDIAGSEAGSAATITVRRHDEEYVVRSWDLPPETTWRTGKYRSDLRGVQCVVPYAGRSQLHVVTTQRSAYGTGSCTVRGEDGERYTLQITQERLER